MTIVCLLPEILISQYSIPFYFGGTSLLIAVTVPLDTVAQIQSHLMAQRYEGLMRKTNLKGKTNAKNGFIMRIVLFGAPGAGKGTQSAIFTRKVQYSSSLYRVICCGRQQSKKIL